MCSVYLIARNIRDSFENRGTPGEALSQKQKSGMQDKTSPVSGRIDLENSPESARFIILQNLNFHSCLKNRIIVFFLLAGHLVIAKTNSSDKQELDQEKVNHPNIMFTDTGTNKTSDFFFRLFRN